MTATILRAKARRAAAALLCIAGAACRPQAGPDRVAPPPLPRAPDGSFQKASDAELRTRLTPEQYDVTQRNGTERPFRNAYWDEHRPGIYVDVVSGEPLFSSLDKFESGTGWPSFTRPLEPDNLTTRTDWKLLVPRTEVRSRLADSHLGHVFADGPPPTGLRYCINSAALRFVPAERLEELGYGEYARAFEEAQRAASAGSARRGVGSHP